MKRTYLDYLEDIEEAMVSACRFVEGMDYASFTEDTRTNFAVVRSIEIIGEAAKNVPSDVQERFRRIPWQDMARMRDKIIHGYFRVRLKVVWDTVTVDIPGALPAVRSCLEVLLDEERQSTEVAPAGHGRRFDEEFIANLQLDSKGYLTKEFPSGYGYELDAILPSGRTRRFGSVRLRMAGADAGKLTVYAVNLFYDPDEMFTCQDSTPTYCWYRFSPDDKSAMRYAVRAVKSAYESKL